MAVRARPHACDQLNRPAELVPDEAEYLALVVTRRVPLAPPVRSLNYSILLMVVVPLAFAMLACGVLKTR